MIGAKTSASLKLINIPKKNLKKCTYVSYVKLLNINTSVYVKPIHFSQYIAIQISLILRGLTILKSYDRPTRTPVRRMRNDL